MYNTSNTNVCQALIAPSQCHTIRSVVARCHWRGSVATTTLHYGSNRNPKFWKRFSLLPHTDLRALIIGWFITHFYCAQTVTRLVTTIAAIGSIRVAALKKKRAVPRHSGVLSTDCVIRFPLEPTTLIVASATRLLSENGGTVTYNIIRVHTSHIL